MDKEHPGYEYDREQIKRARQANLAEYLIRVGIPLVRSGIGRYHHRDHDSLVFTDGKGYIWNSRELNGKKETGNAVDYLTRHMGMDFKTAIYELTIAESTASIGEAITPEPPEIFDFAKINIERDNRRSVAYLSQTRGISYGFIKELIANKLIFQETETNNILFPMYDEVGNIVGAELCGTLTDKRFKGIKTGSEYGYGYSIRGKGKIEIALFFESAIDLLSFADIKRSENSAIDKVILVSMAGLKDIVVKQTLNRQNEPLQPVLCVDNDEAGKEFIKIMTAQIGNIKTFLPDAKYKDWNEQRKAMGKV